MKKGSIIFKWRMLKAAAISNGKLLLGCASTIKLEADTLFVLLQVQVNRLLQYPDWQPIQRCQISFYSRKLRDFLNSFQGLTIRDKDHLSELVSDPTLTILVTKILKHKTVSSNAESFVNDPGELDHVGSRLAFEVALIYKATNKGFKVEVNSFLGLILKSFNFYERLDLILVGDRLEVSGRPAEFLQLKMTILFDFLLAQVDRLLEYPDWSPTKRSEISFYSRKLRHFSKEFQSLTIKDEDYLSELVSDPTLAIRITKILKHKSVSTTSADYLVNDTLDLSCVGKRLAFEVALIYKATTQGFEKAVNSYVTRLVNSFNFDNPRDLNLERGDLVYPFTFTFCSGPIDHDAIIRSRLFPSEFYAKRYFLEQDGGVFVGFQAEATNLLQQLASSTKKKLQVISIVGMAGLGKTTLASRLYNHPYIVSYFYVRLWITVTQNYQKRDLLLSVLGSITEVTDEVCRMSDYKLCRTLYRALEDKRYLIVIDDVWSSNVWDDFKRCFPENNNGSKIMMTTRLKDVALHAQSDGSPLCLRFLTEEESFDLFRFRTFKDGQTIGNLSLIGNSISKKCHGLPLAIVLIAGILKNNFDVDWWASVEESVASYIVTDKNQYMDTLALSYNHLPQHLRHCFLSFGAFKEDYEISVRKLLWLWVAEGFIHQDGTLRNLEDIAEEYLMDLIQRSLVVVGKKGSSGAIKTCRIHDLLRDLCLRKAEEENLLTSVYNHNKHSYSCPHSLTNPTTKSQLLLNTNFLTSPSNCSCYSFEVSRLFFKDVSIVWDTSQLIRSLDISSIELFVFPSELLQLVHLRYLELRFRLGNPPESISHLRELQTLIMSSRMNMVIPIDMWKIKNLRHLCIRSGENLLHMNNVEEGHNLLENLQTMSLVSPTRSCQRVLARTPNLQKLGLCGSLITKSGDLKCPDLGLLMHLETLKLINTIVPLCKAGRLSTSIMFPESLKNLTLRNTNLDWKEAWVFEMIPNLEVLKLKFHAFVGKKWKTSRKAFFRLKYLKIDELDIVTWIASRKHFTVLQHLLVYRCPSLMEIPEDFSNICTLELIELNGCNYAATNSAWDIQKDQESKGNDGLKILLNPGPA